MQPHDYSLPPQSPEFSAMPSPLGYTARPYAPATPAAHGSLTQAWADIGRRPARDTIAAWSQAGPASWTMQSIVASAVLAAAAALFSGVIALARGAQVTTPGAYANAQNTTVGVVIGNVIASPIGLVASLYIVAFALAVFMRSTYGTIGARFEHVLRPLALAQVPVQAVGLVVAILDAIVMPLRHQGAASLGIVVVSLLSLVAGIYSLVLFIQSGAVGSNLRRWVVLGIALLASIVVAILISIIVLPFAAIRPLSH